MSFIQRKFLAKCRLGCLPIRLETGRFCRPILAENERVCQVCLENGVTDYQYKNEIESEIHLLFITVIDMTISEVNGLKS